MLRGIIKHITGAFGGAARLASLSHPERRINDAPPAPTGEWQLIVDGNGDLVTHRAATEHDFLARYPIEYTYGGTIPKYNPADYKDYNEQTAAALIHVTRDATNKALLDKAIFLVSQTDDGRRLLQLAKRESFSFVFDTDRMNNEGAVGLLDYQNRLIPLAEGRDATEVALTVKHELQHLEDIHSGLVYNSQDTIRSAAMAQRALEANARVSESVMAIEAYEGSPSGPPEQFRTSKLFAKFFEKAPAMASAAHKGMADFNNGAIAKFAQRVFPKYWEMASTLDYYDDRLVNSLYKHSSHDPNTVFDPTNDKFKKTRERFRTKESYIAHGRDKLIDVASRDRWESNQDSLKERVTIKGQKFLDENIDLGSATLTALSDRANKNLAHFIELAKPFVPEAVETLTTNLFAPTRQAAVDAVPIKSPFDIYTGNTAKEFESLVFPNRIDGELLAGNEIRSHELTTKVFADHFDKAQAWQTGLDRTSVACSTYEHDYPGNTRGAMSSLIKAGFRAPVAALPQTFIMRLSRCAQTLAQTGANDFSKEELTLMQHWRDMADRGIDPVYGTPVNDPELTPEVLAGRAEIFHAEGHHYFKSYLKSFTDEITPSPQQPAHNATLNA